MGRTARRHPTCISRTGTPKLSVYWTKGPVCPTIIRVRSSRIAFNLYPECSHFESQPEISPALTNWSRFSSVRAAKHRGSTLSRLGHARRVYNCYIQSNISACVFGGYLNVYSRLWSVVIYVFSLDSYRTEDSLEGIHCCRNLKFRPTKVLL